MVIRPAIRNRAGNIVQLDFPERKRLRVFVRMTVRVRNRRAAGGVRCQATVNTISISVVGNNEDVSLGLFLDLLFGVGAAGKKQNRNSGDRSDQTHRTPERDPID